MKKEKASGRMRFEDEMSSKTIRKTMQSADENDANDGRVVLGQVQVQSKVVILYLQSMNCASSGRDLRSTWQCRFNCDNIQTITFVLFSLFYSHFSNFPNFS